MPIRSTFTRFAIVVALLDGCGADDGGGAKGKTCQPGFESREGSCVACPPWTVAKDATGCGCSDGFRFDSTTRVCEPVLPLSDCPLGSMAVLGETACHEIAPCGDGLWGTIADEPGAIHVSASYTGGASDGSRAKPFTTIQAALDAAQPNALVAIAEGRYVENVKLAKPVRLSGRCPSKVELYGSSDSDPTMAVTVSGRVLIDGLTVTGAAPVAGAAGGRTMGISIVRGEIEISHVRIHGVGSHGIGVTGRETRVIVRHTMVENCGSTGVMVLGAKLTVERSVVRDNTPEFWGAGIGATTSPPELTPAELLVRNTVIERNREIGIHVRGSSATVEASVVRDTKLRESNKAYGDGIYAFPQGPDPRPSTLVVRGSLIERNHGAGIAISGSTATIETSVVRKTSPTGFGQDGDGFAVLGAPFSPLSAVTTVRACLFAENARVGFGAFGAVDSVLSNSRLACNEIALGKVAKDGRDPRFDTSAGGNECGCDVLSPCRVESKDVAALPPPRLP